MNKGKSRSDAVMVANYDQQKIKSRSDGVLVFTNRCRYYHNFVPLALGQLPTPIISGWKAASRDPVESLRYE